MNSETISILSLLIAVIAVLFGPLISFFITKRTLRANIKISNKQLISPMRQIWINNLRDLLAEITSKSAHYWVSGTEDRKDSEYYRITELEHKIRLTINPKEEDHQKLVKLVKQMTNNLYSTNEENGTIFWNIT